MSNLSNPYAGWQYDSGPGGYDRTHNAAVNFIYDIPVFRNSQSHLVKTALGGWEISGIVTLTSGLPINIGLSGGQSSNGLPNGTNRPDETSAVSYPHTVAEWFSTSSFTAPASGAWGTLGHNALRGPGRDNWNLAVQELRAQRSTRQPAGAPRGKLQHVESYGVQPSQYQPGVGQLRPGYFRF